MFFGNLPVVFVGDSVAVPKPIGRDVRWDTRHVGYLGCSCGPEILKQRGPRLQTGSNDDFTELRAKINVALAITGDNRPRAHWRHLGIEAWIAEQFFAYRFEIR